MGNINLPGLSTGIDSSKLIEQLMVVESRRIASFKVDKMEVNDTVTALKEVEAKVKSLERAVGSLADADQLDAFKVTSSDRDILSLSANSDAIAGSHTIEVKQLATSETWVLDDSSFTRTSDLVGSGKFIYSYNNQERVITTVGDQPTGNTTLQDLVNMINNDEENPGVTASLLYHNDAYHLVLNGNETGSDHQISINSSTTNVLTNGSEDSLLKLRQNATASNNITDLFQFSGTLEGGEKIIINDTSAGVQVGELNVTDQTSLQEIVDKLNEIYTGTATASVQSGKIIMTEDATGDPFESFELVFDNNGSAASLNISSDNAFTIAGSEAALNTKITELVQFGGTLAGGETITISGTDQAGNAIASQQLSITAETDVQHLIDTINKAYDGLAVAKFEDGKISLTDLQSGTSQTTLNISYDANGGGSTLSPVTLNNTSEGATVGGQLQGEVLSDFDPATANYIETQSAQDSMIKVDGYPSDADDWISTSSNSVSDVISGVTLELNDVTTDTPVQITVSRNKSALKGKIENMVKAFNALMTDIESKTEFNAAEKKMGVLSREITISFLKTQIKTPFTNNATGFKEDIDNFLAAADIGIKFEADGTMTLDSEILEDAIEQNYESVLSLLGAKASGSSDSSNLKYYSSVEDYTQAGEYDVKVTCDDTGNITGAWIKLKSESEAEYRTANWNGNLIIADNGDSADPNPEKGLQLTFNWDGQAHDSASPMMAAVNVKEGIANGFQSMLENVTKASTGRIPISLETANNKIRTLETKIEKEQSRLDRVKQRYVQKFARLEKTLSLMQQQFGALSM